MNLKLITWNMDFWQKQKLQAESWNFLLAKLDADIYLFQESRPPETLMSSPNLVWFAIDGRNWGTGIYSRKYPVRHLPIQTRYIGSLVVGEIKITDDLELTIISLYGLLEQIGHELYSITTLHRMLSDLTGLLNGHMGTKRKIALGGDLNASLQFDTQYGGKAHEILFQRMDDFKLESCFKHTEGFTQTLRNPVSETPWQNDYFFISKPLSRNLMGCKVIDNEDVRRLSDHNPVLIELEL